MPRGTPLYSDRLTTRRSPVPAFLDRDACDAWIAAQRVAGSSWRTIGKKLGMTAESARRRLLAYNHKLEAMQRRLRWWLPLPPESRPIDMGGPRDVWLEWTPEMQAREFAGSRCWY